MPPLWAIKACITLAVVAVLVGGVELFARVQRQHGIEIGKLEVQKAVDAEVKKATKERDDDAAAKRAATEKSHAEDLVRADVQITAGLAARTELERLRNRLRSPGPAASTAAASQAGPGVDATAVTYRLLDECSERYEAVARDAGRYADQVIGLQGFVLANQIGGNSPVAGERPRAGFIGSATQPATGLANADSPEEASPL